MRLDFVDTLAPRPYSAHPASLAGLGGTEMTLIRVAQALRCEGTIEVRQRVRQNREAMPGLAFVPFDPAVPADAFVVINSWKVASMLRRSHPDARILLWLHVFPGRHNRAMGDDLVRKRIEVVCVSRSHARWVRTYLGHDRIDIHTIPNPVDDDLLPDATCRDPDLLLFASSPHKGLDQVFHAFAAARRQIPSLRLAFADPGYLRWPTGSPPAGSTDLGRLSQQELHGWMRRSLCLFYPQTRFAETFGLVIAEANAVGCPALVHRGLGANDEVAGPQQCLDATEPGQIIDRLRQWRRRFPIIHTNPDFRLARVQAAWRDLLLKDCEASRGTALRMEGATA